MPVHSRVGNYKPLQDIFLMSALLYRVRDQILMEGPQIEEPRERELYIDDMLNAMTNIELLERISNALKEGDT